MYSFCRGHTMKRDINVTCKQIGVQRFSNNDTCDVILFTKDKLEK